MLCHITHDMYVIEHTLCCYITHVMLLYNTCYVMLYNT